MERCLGPSSVANSIRRQRQALSLSQGALAETVVPTRVGSVIDAVAGGGLVGVISATLLKLVLGLMLNVSAAHVSSRTRWLRRERTIS